MEWMLQVVDEIDDAVGAVRHRCLGFNAEIGAVLAAVGAVALIGAAFVVGREGGAACAVALLSSMVLAVRIRGSRPPRHG
jgi:hypothetical protein